VVIIIGKSVNDNKYLVRRCDKKMFSKRETSDSAGLRCNKEDVKMAV
jgi:hypothetical protein